MTAPTRVLNRTHIHEFTQPPSGGEFEAGKNQPTNVTLIVGDDGEVFDSDQTITVEPDYVNYKSDDKGWKFIISESGSPTTIMNTFEGLSPLQVQPWAAVKAWVYITDTTKIYNLFFDFFYDSGDNDYIRYSLSFLVNDATIQNGWNLLQWSARSYNGMVTELHKLRITFGLLDATEITIDRLWLICQPKAQILFIWDHNRDKSLVGYPDLKDRNIPNTWGAIPTRVGTADNISEAELLALSQENNNSISFHSWGLAPYYPTRDLSESDLRTETRLTQKWLRDRGYTGGIWRAAWLGNTAPNHAITQDLLYAYGRWDGGMSNAYNIFPFFDRFDVDRNGIHQYNDDAEALPIIFDLLKNTRPLWVAYTHGVSTTWSGDITPDRWAQFISLIDTGLSEGWLEGVTTEILMARAGFNVRQGWGNVLIDHYDDNEDEWLTQELAYSKRPYKKVV